jgi:hypothetical protein
MRSSPPLSIDRPLSLDPQSMDSIHGILLRKVIPKILLFLIILHLGPFLFSKLTRNPFSFQILPFRPMIPEKYLQVSLSPPIYHFNPFVYPKLHPQFTRAPAILQISSQSLPKFQFYPEFSFNHIFSTVAQNLVILGPNFSYELPLCTHIIHSPLLNAIV